MADSRSRQGRSYLDPAILRFVEGTHVSHDAALSQAFQAPDVHGLPAIQVGPSEGKLLGMLARLCGARRIVEVGTLTGYSGLWLAGALPEDGKLWTLELEPQHAAIARACFARAGLEERVEVIEGPALERLAGLEAHAPFDLVFLDADKESYPEYAAWAADQLRSGGLLIADNAYFFGRLLDESEDASSMRRFHESVTAWFDTTCVPTPDGMLIGIRRS